jgi:hypothetical protein
MPIPTGENVIFVLSGRAEHGPCAHICVRFWRRPGATAKPKLSRC